VKTGARGSSWDALAPRYDLQLGLERQALAAALAFAAPAPEDLLLDLGTGTGALLRELAARPVRPRRAIGVDASAPMLARAGRLPKGWELRRTDVTRLPLGDGGVDVVVASYLLHLLSPDELTGALAEARRVLRPGGRLVTVTPTLPTPSLARIAWGLAARASEGRPGGLGGLRPLDPRPALVAAGFALLRARRLRAGYPSLCVLARRPAGSGASGAD
jgi:ubiquinone/menaquinone biosynthesis C-methylase UbiE